MRIFWFYEKDLHLICPNVLFLWWLDTAIIFHLIDHKLCAFLLSQIEPMIHTPNCNKENRSTDITHFQLEGVKLRLNWSSYQCNFNNWMHVTIYLSSLTGGFWSAEIRLFSFCFGHDLSFLLFHLFHLPSSSSLLWFSLDSYFRFFRTSDRSVLPTKISSWVCERNDHGTWYVTHILYVLLKSSSSSSRKYFHWIYFFSNSHIFPYLLYWI